MSVEPAVKRFVFQSKGNKHQFEHAESVLDKLESAKDTLNINATSKAKTAIKEGVALVTKRMKIIKIADKSQYSWATIQEYLSDELASDSEDKKRLFHLERRAEKKVTEAKKISCHLLTKGRKSLVKQKHAVLNPNGITAKVKYLVPPSKSHAKPQNC